MKNRLSIVVLSSVLLFGMSHSLSAQVVQRGLMLEYNEELAKSPLGGVEVVVRGAPSSVSDASRPKPPMAVEETSPMVCTACTMYMRIIMRMASGWNTGAFRNIFGWLAGQNSIHSGVDYWKDSDTSYKLYDEGRNIQIYYTTAPSLSASQVDDSSLVQEHEEESPGNFDRSAVDALANLQLTYDYYLANFQQQGVTGDAGTDLKVITNIQNYNSQNMSDNAFMSGTRMMGVGVAASDDKSTKSAELDVMGHEYTHGVVNAKTGNRLLQGALNGQQSVQFAISECMADIMGEFVEDYSDDTQLDNSCDWVHGSRSMIQPSGKYLDDAEEFIEGTTDCHYGITILSHPAYLIANGSTNTT